MYIFNCSSHDPTNLNSYFLQYCYMTKSIDTNEFDEKEIYFFIINGENRLLRNQHMSIHFPHPKKPGTIDIKEKP